MSSRIPPPPANLPVEYLDKALTGKQLIPRSRESARRLESRRGKGDVVAKTCLSEAVPASQPEVSAQSIDRLLSCTFLSSDSAELVVTPHPPLIFGYGAKMLSSLAFSANGHFSS
jgi:hypothetical protein